MASAQLSQFTHMFPIQAIPKTPTTTVFPLQLPLYSSKINNSNISQATETRKESEYLEVRNETLENDPSSNSSRALPRVVLSAHFSPKRAPSPSEFSSSPVSYSSADEDIIASEQDAITTLASLAVEERRKIHLSPAFSSVASSAVSSPPSSPCPQSPRRSARKPKPSTRSKEQILGKRRFSGPATRLRKHKSVITEDDEKEEYYRERAAPIPSIEAPYTKTRRIPIPVTGGDGVVGCGGYKFIPPNNPNYPNYPIPPKKSEILSTWSPIQSKMFLASYLEHGKDFSGIGKQVNKPTAQVVEFYYLIKHTPKFRNAKAMKKELESYEEDINKNDAQIKNLAKLAFGKRVGGRKKKATRN